ncbi:ParB N-terminal domain-containing protein [Leptospira andrefontaineae]|uniref:Chromosome partitioning protein ParB n=1 Tax=Leptospira andrefontaineae TaxID=2484976 RepID=A0A4R9H704_9LEPT|nr:ParB N-terminal domain-containing protein [Leptospira andrefontaineae]TGK41245.1 chromosome partitioning protein ParB [Leptospira andrefontaineae]
MEVLSEEAITPEIAETILDKIHLAISKEHPDWQEVAMSEELTDEEENSLNSLSRIALHKVLLSSKKELTNEAKITLAKEFKKLKSKFLSQYLISWADFESGLQVEKSFFPFFEGTEKKPSIKSSEKKDQPTSMFLQGLKIQIQIQKGSLISGIDSRGKKWHKRTYYDIGILRNDANAGELIEVLIGPNLKSEFVFIINEVLSDGTFDVHKALIGFRDDYEAKSAYLLNSNKKANTFGSIVRLTISQFKDWINLGEFSKELKNPELEIRKSRLRSIGLLSEFDLEEVFSSGQIYITKSTLATDLVRKQIIVHGKHGNYTANRLVRIGEPESKIVPRNSEEPETRRKRGRPSFPEGHKRIWSDGKEREKTKTGWKITSSPTKKTDNVRQIVKQTRKSKQDQIPKPTKGEIIPPTSLPFSQIRTINQYTEKADYDRKQIDSLKQRIDHDGYDNAFPITVDKQEGRWTIVAGHHRYEAVKELIEEGKLPSNFKIPVVTKEFTSGNKRLAAQVAENQRRSVLATDEAKAYGKMQENGWDAKKISEELGISVGEVNKRLALINLSPDLFALVKKKDRSLPLGIAEVIGMFAMDANGKPNSTIQIKAFKWYVENRSKYPGKGPSVVQEYIKELQSGEFDNFDFDSVATEVQREGLRTVGSMEKARANQKMLEVMLDSLSKSYQRILGDNINSLTESTVQELAASLAVTSDKGVNSSSVLGKLDVIIQDLSVIKNSIQKKMRDIEANASTPLMFARSFLFEIEDTIQYAEEVRDSERLQIFKARIHSLAA